MYDMFHGPAELPRSTPPSPPGSVAAGQADCDWAKSWSPAIPVAPAIPNGESKG